MKIFKIILCSLLFSINAKIIKFKFNATSAFSIIISITLFHIVIIVLWAITNNIKSEGIITDDLKLFYDCVYPKSEIIWYNLN